MSVDARVGRALAEIEESVRRGVPTSQRLSTLHESRRRRTIVARASLALTAMAVLVLGIAAVDNVGSTRNLPISPAPSSTPTPTTSTAAALSIQPLVGSPPFEANGGLAVSPSGTVYVSDFNSANHRSRILAVTSTGRVTTFADEAAATWDAGFRAISVDASGTVYAVSGQEIRKFGVDGRMSTLAGKTEVGSLNTPARVKDGIGTEARFDTVLGMAVSPSGNLYVTDSGQVRKITPQGKVTTLATCAAGVTDCLGWPGTIAVDAGGTIYIGSDDYMIRRITPAGQVTVMAVGDTTSGTGLFHRMTLAVDPTNATLLAADTLGLHKIAPDGTVTSVATAKAGRFGPMTVATNGTLYAVADQNVIVTMGPT